VGRDADRDCDAVAFTGVGEAGEDPGFAPADGKVEQQVAHAQDIEAFERTDGGRADAWKRCRIGKEGVEPVGAHSYVR
jgi:hypothetical protein